MTPPDPVLGRRLFTDGTTRPVYLDAGGRQYVEDERVYGPALKAGRKKSAWPSVQG